MKKQVRLALNGVREFISGKSEAAQPIEFEDQDLRAAVAAELLAAMSGVVDPQQVSSEEAERLSQEQERSRQLFIQHGYFDQAVQDLRTGTAKARAAAARALGLVGNQRATTDLIAAMFDDDEAVRAAAGEALTQLNDPNVAPRTEADGLAAVEGLATEIVVEEELATNTEVAGVADVVEDSMPIVQQPLEEVRPENIVETSEADTQKEVAAEDSDEQLALQEHSIQESIERYQRLLAESGVLRQKAENEARLRSEREAKIREEAEVRRIKEEEIRRGAEEEAARRRAVEAEAVAAESSAREQAEAEVHRLAEEEMSYRLEVGKLRNAAAEVAHRQWQLETTRREAAEAARLAEAIRVRQEAEQQHQQEIAEIENAELALLLAIEETTKRRAELETSRQNAESEIAALVSERAKLLAEAEAEIIQLLAEKEQNIAAAASRRAEAERLRTEAEERKRAEEAALQQQLDLLNKLTSEITDRRAEVESEREKAAHDAEQLAQALVRMRAAEEARERAEQKRLQVEADTKERVENEERLLAEARQRALDEQARWEEEKRRHDEAEEERMAALVALHEKTEAEAGQRADREQQLNAEIDHIRIADAEVRRRIEEAETLRRTLDQAYRVAAEKVQRIEAEAHAAAKEEEQALAKLEAVRRNVAAEAQTRAAQERRIKEEIEQFQRLENEERPRIEAAILQRTAAAARLQQLRESSAKPAARVEEPAVVPASETATPAVGVVGGSADPDLPSVEPTGMREVQPAIGNYLNSVDPYKRAAGVAELARLQGKEAFPSIAACFDDNSEQVRNAAARALYQLEPAHTVDFFNRALEEAPEERRRKIGRAIATSGLAAESIDRLASQSREDTYNALSILFVMAKTGEVKPLLNAVAEHENDEVSKAVVKLLTLSGQGALAEAAARKRTK